MCSCAAGSSDKALLRGPGRPPGAVEAVEQVAADLVLLQHHSHRLLGRPRAMTLVYPIPSAAGYL